MKKVMVMAAILLVASGAWAQEFRPKPKQLANTFNNLNMTTVWRHTYSAADTVAGAAFRDTVYSPWYEVPAASKFFFTYYIDGKHAYEANGYKDTVRALDSMNLNFQTAVSMYGDVMTTTNLGVLKHATSPADLDTVIQYAATLARDTVCMRSMLIRAMVVMMDSTSSAASRPTLKGNTYTTSINLILNAKP